ncbi:MAG: hypothetical protein HZA01_12725 [Nitrospinae bacterium]|nr:hypothetical protein [Nitrospinota bacterium]
MPSKNRFKIASIILAAIAFLIVYAIDAAHASSNSSKTENIFMRGDDEGGDREDFGEDGGDHDDGHESSNGDDGTHNPGRDCSSCHHFTLSGTVYSNPSGGAPAQGAIVSARTSQGIITMETDRLGNFYTKQNFYGPYAITITQGSRTAAMATQPSYGGCNSTGCHEGKSLARVYINNQATVAGPGNGNAGNAGNGGNNKTSSSYAYNPHVKKILDQKCTQCHARGKSPLNYYGKVMRYVKPGSVRSKLLKKTQKGGSMSYYLTPAETEILKSWIINDKAQLKINQGSAIGGNNSGNAGGGGNAAQVLTYIANIKGILDKKCVVCHSKTGPLSKSPLTSYAETKAFFTPGDPSSKLITGIRQEILSG